MGIVSWTVLGAIVGVLVNRLLPGRFPGGLIGTVVGGMAGAVLGGTIFSLAARRTVPAFDPAGLLVAFVGAALLLMLVRKAGYSRPRTQ